jgi:hypothetical protein
MLHLAIFEDYAGNKAAVISQEVDAVLAAYKETTQNNYAR